MNEMDIYDNSFLSVPKCIYRLKVVYLLDSNTHAQNLISHWIYVLSPSHFLVTSSPVSAFPIPCCYAVLRHSTATTAAVVNTQSGVLTLTSVSDIGMTAAQGKMIFYSTYFSSLGITGLFLSTIIVMLAMIFTAWVKYVLNGFWTCLVDLVLNLFIIYWTVLVEQFSNEVTLWFIFLNTQLNQQD